MAHINRALGWLLVVGAVTGLALWPGCAGAPAQQQVPWEDEAASSSPVSQQEAAEEAAGQQEAARRAASMLEEAEAKMAAEDFDAAAALIQELEGTEAYARQRVLRATLADLKRRLAAAKTRAAQHILARAEQAYEAMDYGAADELLGRLEGLNVKLGGRRQRKAVAMRRTVSAALQRCGELLQEGERLYEMGNYEDARGVFLQLQQMGTRCGPETRAAVSRYLATIDKEARDRQLAEAAETLRRLEEMERKRREAIEKLRERERIRAEAINKAELAETSWDAGQFAQAKPLLQEARRLLEQLGVARDEELQRVKERVQARLAVVDEKVAAQQQREANAARLEEMFATVQALRTAADLLGAERRLAEAEQFARRAELSLTSDQRRLADEVRAAVEAAYGEQRRQRAERYWQLVVHSDDYARIGEWQNALALLETVEQAEGVRLPPERAEALSERLRRVRAQLEARGETTEQVTALIREAQARLEAGEGEDALARCREAWSRTQSSGVPLGRCGPVLACYEKVASAVLPQIVEAQVGRLREAVEEAMREARWTLKVCQARFYVEQGSWDVARPLLEAIAADEEVAAEHRQWAAEQMEGIDERITALRQDELLATRDRAETVYELEMEFQKAVERQDPEAAERLNARVGAARAAWLAARAELALGRGAYPLVEQMLREGEGLVAEHAGATALNELVKAVQQWRGWQERLAEALEALQQHDLERASRAVLALQEAEGLPDYLRPAVLSLQSAREALVQFEAQTRSLQKDREDALRSIRAWLAADRARRLSWESYLKATTLHADGNWSEAAAALGELVDHAAALHSFESERARQMLAEAEQKAEAMTTARRAEEAEHMLRQVEARIAARHFRQAANMLDAIESDEIYGSYEIVRTRAAELRALVEQAEQEAAALYERAAQAYEAGDREALKQLLDELSTKYQYTRVYDERHH